MLFECLSLDHIVWEEILDKNKTHMSKDNKISVKTDFDAIIGVVLLQGHIQSIDHINAWLLSYASQNALKFCMC